MEVLTRLSFIYTAVYMKDNRVSTDKKDMIYEYTKNASRVNSIRVYDATDLLQYIKRK